MDRNSVSEGTRFDIFHRLCRSISINLHSIYNSVGKPLCHHQRYQSCTRSDIQDAFTALCPRTKQNPICTDFESAGVLTDGELLEMEYIFGALHAKIIQLFYHYGCPTVLVFNFSILNTTECIEEFLTDRSWLCAKVITLAGI